MRTILVFLFLLISFQAVSNEKLALAYTYLEYSELKKAIPLFQELANTAFQQNNAETYVQAQLGLAEAYTDLGTYNISIKTLNSLLLFLDAQKPQDYLSYAKLHRLLADNYAFLFLHSLALHHSNKFIHYYRLHAPNEEIYEALYHTYLGHYYNIKFDIPEAYKNTSKALEIYHQNKTSAHLIDVYKIYENHSFTLRNHPHSPKNYKHLYTDSLKTIINKRFPYDNIKKARAIIAMTAVEMDDVYNTLTILNPDSLNIETRDKMVAKVNSSFQEGVAIYNKLIGPKADYLPRYHTLQAYLHYANEYYYTALDNLQNAKASYANDQFVNQGFAANNFRILSILRSIRVTLDGLRQDKINPKLEAHYLENLLLFEKNWDKYLLDQIQDNSSFTFNIYNQNPYQYLFEYYANLYLRTQNKAHLLKAHEYEEKTKYSSLLTTLSLTKSQKAQRQELIRKKNAISTALDTYFVSSFLGEEKDAIHQAAIQKKIDAFYAFQTQNNLDASLQIQPIDSIQANLPPNKAQLSYTYVSYGNEKLYAKVITKDTVSLRLIKTTGPSATFKMFKPTDTLYQSLVNHDVKTFKNNSFQLYKEVFAPIADLFPPNITEIEIVPFSDLENLPFDMLITNQSSSEDFRELPYLVHKYAFNYAMSATIKQLSTQQNHNYETDFVVYNPAFEGQTQSELNLAKQVSKDLAKRYKGEVFANTQATLENFKKSLKTSRIVTLFSHGFATSNSNTNSKGVYLQDDFLNMDTVYTLEAKTDFLILTACQTGNGFRDRGEGNVNLVRAFRAIGVKSMLIANWDIDEKISLQIVSQFFKYMESGMTKSEALNKAKIAHLNASIPRHGNPLYWAGINVVGANSPIVLTTAWYNNLNSLPSYAIGFLLVLVIILWAKKRF
ncbi:CHAT domain-containing protein [Bizionia sediminis]|uniref:CHAT domain-containing protein n=1 Tax=Bizionia sediminis TaxID=1737064 RepID=A0ABW5KT08_9FLAO